MCNLTNLDLRLVCYDITSSYFETVAVGQRRFSSLAFGYSRDHRSDRPQIVIGLFVTGDGIPIAHHVFSGNTSDVSTLPGVMEDLQARFGVGRIALVADRGLISEDNLDEVAPAASSTCWPPGFITTTRSHPCSSRRSPRTPAGPQ